MIISFPSLTFVLQSYIPACFRQPDRISGRHSSLFRRQLLYSSHIISAACIFQQIPLFRPLLFHSVKIETDVLQLPYQHSLVDLHTGGTRRDFTNVGVI